MNVQNLRDSWLDDKIHIKKFIVINNKQELYNLPKKEELYKLRDEFNR